MKAFLSHSSRDKHLVDDVAHILGGANVEKDSITFDHGLVNVAAIFDSLKRSSIYVLFLTSDALKSKIVRFEALLAQELLARGVIEKFLVICLDNEAFSAAEDHWKIHNFVRSAVSAQSIARLIQHHLIVARARGATEAQRFVGRSKELDETKTDLGKPENANAKALFISGNAGVGRRTFAKRIYRDVFPSVNSILPEINIDFLDGYHEIYKKLHEVVTPISTLSALRARAAAISIGTDEQKARLIAQLLERLLEAREAIIINDYGGLLGDRGGLNIQIKNIIDKVSAYPHPPIIFIAERMIPKALRFDLKGIVYKSLPPLETGDVRQLISFALRDQKIHFDDNDLDGLVELSDCHPFNAHFMIEAIREHTLPVFMADTSEFHQWKRGRGSEFLQKIIFSSEEVLVVSALRDFQGLDFKVLQKVIGGDVLSTGVAIRRLQDLHIIQAIGDLYQISPPLRVAIEREAKFSLPHHQQKQILKIVGDTLNAVTGDDSIASSMIDAAILAKLQCGEDVPELFSAFLLPSHLVWLARRKYNEKRYGDCIRLARSALDGIARLSSVGIVEASRYLCLAAARLDKDKDFLFGISVLRQRSGSDSYARSNVNFLQGFNARLKGNLPEAEGYFRKAYDDSPGNFSAARELASICLIRGDLSAAEGFARKAYATASDNPYILDILLSVLIKHSKSNRTKYADEISSLFNRLEQVGEEEGRSFYVSRRAEYELKYGDINEACALIDEAVRKTPGIFYVHALRAEIYLERGNKAVAHEEIKTLQDIVYKKAGPERLTNLRPLLEVEATYLAAVGDFGAAKAIYRKRNVFTEEEAARAIKNIEYEQGFSRR